MATPSTSLTPDAAVDTIKQAQQNGLHKLLQGAEADVREYVLDLSRYSAKIAAEPNQATRIKLLKSLRSQAKMLADLNRIRVVR